MKTLTSQMWSRSTLLAAAATFASVQLLSQPVAALDDGVGRTPAMGWNSWNLYACNINEEIVKNAADALIDTGLAALGYTYINIDDCWQIGRYPNKTIKEDFKRFPSGMGALAKQIHAKGLKFGLYSSAGNVTCEKRPGGYHFEDVDAQRYAEWEIDYLKYDNCGNQGMSDLKGTLARYEPMRDALNKTGRHILYSMCNWGEANVWEWGHSVGHSWRTTWDICDSYEGKPCSAMTIVDLNLQILNYSKPGGFNDMDMLEVGNGGMTNDEYRSHFSAWAALKSPLLLGNDVTKMDPVHFEIVSNPEVIAINQDPLGVSAHLALTTAEEDGFQVLVGPLENGDQVVLVLNRGKKDAPFTLHFHDLPEGDHHVFGGKLAVRDLWARKNLGRIRDKIVFGNIRGHGVKMYRLKPEKLSLLDGVALTLFGGVVLVGALAYLYRKTSQREGYSRI